ncbi:MAG: filamentous hemagglutinin N-terminal domain-containing protein [Cyanobacteria bacterium J06639_16]
MEVSPSLFIRTLSVGCLLSTGGLFAKGYPVCAQIQPDDSLGPTPSVLTNDASTGQLLIEGGASRGSTLFHSFRDFNIAAGNNAYFVNPDNIDLIVSRVTGESASNLFGTLGVLGEADLFFINPNGIFFEAGSTLDLNGSFIASTADSIGFDNEFIFSAVTPETPPLLTISVPTGLQFDQQPGPISYQTEGGFSLQTLSVSPGRTLSLIGGDLNFNRGNIESVRGRIELGSVAELGTVEVFPIEQGWTFNYDNIQTFGNLSATGSSISTATRSFFSLITGIPDADNDLDDDNPGGDIVIQAKDINLSLSTVISTNTFSNISAGNITINTQNLSVGSFSVISSRAVALNEDPISGSSGDIFINASESVFLNGGSDQTSFITPTGISTDLTGGIVDPFLGGMLGDITGNGGDITINTQRLLITEGATILSSSTTIGDAGDVTINATELVEVSGFFIGASAFLPSLINSGADGGSGAGGELLINTERLVVQDGGAILASSEGSGAGGNIEVNADSVDVIGSFSTLDSPDSIEIRSVIAALAEDEGDAGQILIDARNVYVQNGGEITTETTLGSEGNGNLLAVKATEEVRIEGASAVEAIPSGLFSSTAGRGNAGEVLVETERLSIADGGEISAATLSETTQSSGSVALNVGYLKLDNGNVTVETSAQSGSGAEITIADLDVLLLQNGSQISAEAFSGANGGNIRVDAPDGFVIATLDGDSDILARANQGNGGDIEVVALNILGLVEGLAIPGNGTNDIDASSSFGGPGAVLLDQLGVIPAPEAAALAATTGVPEISQQCNPSQTVSSFVVTGRGGVPLEPQAAVPEIVWTPPNRAATPITAQPSTIAEATSTVPESLPEDTPIAIVEAQGWHTNAVGQIVLTASTTETIPDAITAARTHCSLGDS